MLLKVGELAKRTGLTVRALHHYDAIGLLAPSARSDSGYRLYNRNDIARLHAIQAMRQIGIPLADIGNLLTQGEPLSAVVQRQMAMLDKQIAQANELRNRLQLLQINLTSGTEPDLSEWLSTLELMSTYGKYFTPAELKQLMEGWRRTESEWLPLIKATREAMNRQLDPCSLEAQPLARQWMDLTMRWLGGDFELLSRWENMVTREPVAQNRNGVDPAMRHYIRQAIDLRLEALHQYFSPDELKRLQDIDDEWMAFGKEAQRAMKKNLPPHDKKMQTLLVCWDDLIDRTANREPALRKKLLLAYGNDPVLRAGAVLGVELQDFMRNARTVIEGRKSP
ncbi:MAG: MerR family transcriptional regulator [Burkholderiales bacterium]|nr:MerR family transcriptional regulator [Burkholderiales bacterium]